MSRVAAVASETPCTVMMPTDDHNCFPLRPHAVRQLQVPPAARDSAANAQGSLRLIGGPAYDRERGRLSSRDSIKYLI